MKEIWKDIPGYEGSYQVSNLGNVKSLKFNKERILKPYLYGDIYTKYKGVTLSGGDKIKTYKIHQLVVMAFLGHTPNGHEIVVNHIDNNQLNNRLDNLELVSQRYNTSFARNANGCTFRKKENKWFCSIRITNKKININNKRIYLGLFINKEDGIDMYQKAIANIHLYNGDNKEFRNKLKEI